MESLSKLLALILNLALFFGVACGTAALMMLFLPLVGVHLGFWGCYLVFIGFRLLNAFSEIADKASNTFE